LAQDPSIETVNANNGYLGVSFEKPGVEDYSFIPARLLQAAISCDF